MSSIIVTVTADDLASVRDQGTVVLITGTAESGRRVTFAGDHRPMYALIEALPEHDGSGVPCEVAPWQIIGGDDTSDQW